MSKVEIEWSKDKLSGDVAAQADFVGPSGKAQSVAMRLNAEAMKQGHLAHRYVPYISKMGSGLLEVKWSKDPSSGDLIGEVAFTGPDGKPQRLSARANEALIKNELLKRFQPQALTPQKAVVTHAASGNIFGDVVHAVSHAASSIAHGSVVKSIGKAVHSVMNNPITHVVMPATLVNKIATTTPIGREITSKVLTSVLGPAAPALGPTVLKAMGNVVYGAQQGNPKAMAYVQQLTQKAAAGDPASNQLATLMNLVKQFPAPAPVPALPALPPVIATPKPVAPHLPSFAEYERMLRSAISGYDPQEQLLAISGATPDVPGMSDAITQAVSHIFGNPIASSVVEGAAKAFFGEGAAAFNAIPSILAVASRLMSKAAAADPGAVAYVARAVEASKHGDEGAKHLVNVMNVLNQPAPTDAAPVNHTAQPIPEALPGVHTPAPSYEYLAAVQQQVAAAAGCAAGDPMNAASGHFQLDNGLVQIPTLEFQQIMQAAGAKIATDGVWGERSINSLIELCMRLAAEIDPQSKAVTADQLRPFVKDEFIAYNNGKTMLVTQKALQGLARLIVKAQTTPKTTAASGQDLVEGTMDAVEQYHVGGAPPNLRDELYTISGAGAPPSEVQLAETLIAKAAKGDKEALEFMGLIKKRAEAKDQAAIRMQTLLTQASHRIAARVDAAKKAAAKQPAAPAPSSAPSSQLPTEGGPIARASGGGGEVVFLPDPAHGIAVSGLEAYVPPSEKDLRASATLQYALKVMEQAAAGNVKAKQLIDVLRARHTQGDVSASALLWFLHQAWLMRRQAAGAAAGGSVAYGDNAWNPAPMNVRNYYQISGQNLGPFYEQPGYPLQGNVVAPDGRTMVIAGEDDVDMISGAGGRLLKKAWDGRKWVWQDAGQTRPVFAARPGFGMKDAMAAGRYAMQRRQLRA
jgi:hypothetical protein